jgi:DNA-binding HxlR family transcriptional regulator
LSLKQRRSDCPISAFLEVLGDRWSLLIVRDIMFRRMRTYREFVNSEEGIATNILANRLRKLVSHGIVRVSRDPADQRGRVYTLTSKGVDLAPAMIELVLWGADHEGGLPPQGALRRIKHHRAALLAAIRRNSGGSPRPSR